MSWLDKVVSIATGGIADKAIKIAETWFPPDMSEAEKEQVRMAFERMEMERDNAVERAATEAEQAVTERIKALEGTAADLKAVPIIGPLVLFLRGLQRPLWGFFCLLLDWNWFTAWHDLSEKQETALIIINFLVLGFLFGERAVRNCMPMFQQIMNKKRGDA